jgi:hypothetical protein
MRGKKAKLLRKKEVIMDDKPAYSLQQVEQYVALHVHLMGEKPSEIYLDKKAYNWYVQEVNSHAENLGLNIGFKNEDPEFYGIKIKQKTTIVK